MDYPCLSWEASLEPRGNSQNLNWLRTSWFSPTTSESLIQSMTILCREIRRLLLVSLVLFTETARGIPGWDSLQHMDMMLLPDGCQHCFIALHCAVVDLVAQSISCSVFYIGAHIWDIFVLASFIFLLSSCSSKKLRKTAKITLVLVHVKPTN